MVWRIHRLALPLSAIRAAITWLCSPLTPHSIVVAPDCLLVPRHRFHQYALPVGFLRRCKGLSRRIAWCSIPWTNVLCDHGPLDHYIVGYLIVQLRLTHRLITQEVCLLFMVKFSPHQRCLHTTFVVGIFFLAKYNSLVSRRKWHIRRSFLLVLQTLFLPSEGVFLLLEVFQKH